MKDRFHPSCVAKRRQWLAAAGLLMVAAVVLQARAQTIDDSYFLWDVLTTLMLAFCALGLWKRRRLARTSDAAAFWGWLTIGILLWLAAHLADWAVRADLFDSLRIPVSAASGLLYVGLYVAFLAALLRLVPAPPTGGKDILRGLDFVGLILFAVGIQAYFVAIPAALGDAGWQALGRGDAYFPNVFLDVYLLAVCLVQSRNTPAHRHVLRALAFTALCWTATDLLDLLSFFGGQESWYPPSPSLWELLWFAWFVPLVWAIGSPLGNMQKDTAGRTDRTEVLRSWLPLAGFAFFVPSLHLALHALGWLDDSLRSSRDAFTLSYFGVQAGLLLWKQKRQERVVRDLEDSQELTLRRLREERSRAESALRAKSDFLATMSHELRTPMTGILGAASLLGERPLGESERELVQILHGSGDILRRLLDDILDLSKIEAGKLELSNVEFDPRQEIEAVAALFRDVAAGKGLRFDLEMARDTPTRVIGDPLRLRQIVTNLLSNAVKFTDRGRVGIDLSANSRADASHAVNLRIQVSDSGVGIPEDEVPRIFESFEQLDGSSTRRHEGSGLGLAICRRLLDLMGGEIHVDSRPRVGSTFSIEVPVRLPGQAPETLRRKAQTPVAGQKVAFSASEPEPTQTAEPLGWNVLIAEDLDVNQSLMEAMLKSLGCTSEIANNGREALERMDDQSFDLVLMDVRMPEMDGLEATRHIRERFVDRESDRPSPHFSPDMKKGLCPAL